MSGQVLGNSNFESNGPVNKFRFSSANKQYTNKRKRVDTIKSETLEAKGGDQSSVGKTHNASKEILSSVETNSHEVKKLKLQSLKSDKDSNNPDESVKVDVSQEEISAIKDYLEKEGYSFENNQSISEQLSKLPKGKKTKGNSENLLNSVSKGKIESKNSSSANKIDFIGEVSNVKFNAFVKSAGSIFVEIDESKNTITLKKLNAENLNIYLEGKQKGNVADLAYGPEIGNKPKILASPEFYEKVAELDNPKIVSGDVEDKEIQDLIDKGGFEAVKLSKEQVAILDEFIEKHLEYLLDPVKSKKEDKKEKRVEKDPEKNSQPTSQTVYEKKFVESNSIEVHLSNYENRLELEEEASENLARINEAREEELEKALIKILLKIEEEEKAQERNASNRIAEKKSQETFHILLNKSELFYLKFLNLRNFLKKNLDSLL